LSTGAARVRLEWRDVDGIVLLDKPVGLSSNAALQRVRRLYRARKAGHTGSLDPLASGLLPLCLGQATKVAGLLLEADKTYRARLTLGSRTDSGDLEGLVIERRPVPVLERAVVERALGSFVGEREQVPPMYSALKRAGEPLYRLARRGQSVERAARPITITRLTLTALDQTSLEFELACSKGTYVRTLGEDLAGALGSCGHLTALRRLAIAGFEGQRLWPLAELESLAGREPELEALLLPADAALGHFPALSLDAAETAAILNGRAVALDGGGRGRVRLYDHEQRFLGLGRFEAEGRRLQPVRLMRGDGG
jgi:tRNA pseudouridine55 synthase